MVFVVLNTEGQPLAMQMEEIMCASTFSRHFLPTLTVATGESAVLQDFPPELIAKGRVSTQQELTNDYLSNPVRPATPHLALQPG